MTTNPYIVAPFIAWVVAQGLKFTISALKGKLDFRLLFGSGGMPSAHSALVCALAVTALAVSGSESPIFGLTIIFAAIVMYDSFGVRRAAGDQAHAINQIFNQIDRTNQTSPYHHIREVLGHKPSEVFAGAVLGSLIGFLFNFNRLSGVGTFLQGVPEGLEINGYTLFCVLLILAGLAVKLWGVKYKNIVAIKAFTNRLFAALETIGFTIGLLVFAQYEKAAIISYRIWLLLAVVGLGSWSIYIISHYGLQLKPALLEAADKQRKAYWLRSDKKKNKKHH